MTLLNDIDVGGTKYKYANSIPMGTCATPAGSEVKECAFADSFKLAVGNLISVTFTYANTYGDGSTTYPKLLINGTQYPVKQPVGGYASSGAWANGQAVTFMFDGTNLVFLTVPVVDTVAANNMNSVSSNAVFDAVNVCRPIVSTPYLAYVIRKYTVTRYEGSAGKTVVIVAAVSKHNISYNIQLSWGTSDPIVQQMSGEGRENYAIIDQNSTPIASDTYYNYYRVSFQASSSSNYVGIGGDVDIGIADFHYE